MLWSRSNLDRLRIKNLFYTGTVQVYIKIQQLSQLCHQEPLSHTAIVGLVHFNRLQQKMSSSTTLVSGDNYIIPHFVCAEYVATPYHSWLLADMVLSHSVSDLCLVGPRGCGKSALVRQLAASLGYQTETIQLYQVTLALAIRQRPSSCTR